MPTPLTRLRRTPVLLETARIRRRNQAFFGELADRTRGAACARSLAVLRHRADVALDGPLGPALRDGSGSWTERRFGLQHHAETAALQAVSAGQRDLAEWLSAALLDAGKSQRAVHVRALLAVRAGDRAEAMALRARETKAAAGAVEVAAWVDQQLAWSHLRTRLTALAGTPDGDVAEWWAAASRTAGRESLDHAARAVADALRPGRTGPDPEPYLHQFEARVLTAGPKEARGYYELITGAAPVDVPAAARGDKRPEPAGGGAAVVLYAGARAGHGALAPAAARVAALASGAAAPTPVVLHAGLRPDTVTEIALACPSARFLRADAEHHDRADVDSTQLQRLRALDALRLTGFDRVIVAPAGLEAVELLAEALAWPAIGSAGAAGWSSRLDDPAQRIFAFDGALAGGSTLREIDRMIADPELVITRRTPWAALATVRDVRAHPSGAPGLLGRAAPVEPSVDATPA